MCMYFLSFIVVSLWVSCVMSQPRYVKCDTCCFSLLSVIIFIQRGNFQCHALDFVCGDLKYTKLAICVSL